MNKINRFQKSRLSLYPCLKIIFCIEYVLKSAFIRVHLWLIFHSLFASWRNLRSVSADQPGIKSATMPFSSTRIESGTE